MKGSKEEGGKQLLRKSIVVSLTVIMYLCNSIDFFLVINIS